MSGLPLFALGDYARLHQDLRVVAEQGEAHSQFRGQVAPGALLTAGECSHKPQTHGIGKSGEDLGLRFGVEGIRHIRSIRPPL